MGPTKAPSPIGVTFGNETPVVGIYMPYREPFLIWVKADLEDLINKLLAVNQQWNERIIRHG